LKNQFQSSPLSNLPLSEGKKKLLQLNKKGFGVLRVILSAPRVEADLPEWTGVTSQVLGGPDRNYLLNRRAKEGGNHRDWKVPQEIVLF